MSDTPAPQPPQEPPVPVPGSPAQPGPVVSTEPAPPNAAGSSATQAASSYPYADQQGYQQAYQQQQQAPPPPPETQQGVPYTQSQGYQYTPASPEQMYPGAKPTRYRKERLVAGILALVLGSFGAHKFYLGYTTEAVIMLLLLTVGSCLILGPLAAVIISLVEGITYLLKSDEEFERIYVYNKKGWF